MRLQRSQDALAGGVCAGLAKYLGVDTVVVRTLMVLLCLMTLGLGVLVYVILWVSLPLEPNRPSPVDVLPHEVSSETYGIVDVSLRDASSVAGGAQEARDETEREVAARRDMYTAAGHEPPTPPLAAHAAAALVASRLASSSPSSHEPVSTADVSARNGAVGGGCAPKWDAPAEAPSDGSVGAGRRHFVLPPLARMLLLWVCLAAAFVGLLRLLGFFVSGTSWWRFWPMFFVLTGIAVMVVPGKPGLRMAHAITGWFFVIAGFVVLPMSVGLVRWASLVPWLQTLWPLLVLSVAYLIVGWVRKMWPWALGAGVLFAVFCLAGLILFAEPGQASSVAVTLPLGRTIEFSYPFV